MSEPMNFPNDWPENCPPQDAADAEGVVFRIVKNDPPSTSDFASHYETGRLLTAPECLRRGLSVFRDYRDAVHQQKVFPKLGSLIAEGSLAKEHGKTKLTSGTQPTHTTWWTYEGVDRAALFSVIREEV